MKQRYQVVEKKDSQKIAEYLAKNGELLLPLVDLLESSRMAIEELIDVTGRASIEAVLLLSASNLAGAKARGRRGGDIVWHGSQAGTVELSDRKLRVTKPRLRRKGVKRGGEVEVPAYTALNSGEHLRERILQILMEGVSTRSYQKVIPAMAETVGISKSSISREFIEASGEELSRLLERRFDQVEFLIIYIDGLVFGEHHVIGAVGVDREGKKQVLGLVAGASENGAAATSLLEDLVARGVASDRKYLFVIDGSKALRSAINKVFGADNPVQRCRNHKVKNVCDQLPEELSEQVKAFMKAAYKLPWKEGMEKLKKQAQWLCTHYPAAGGSLMEGLEETFTINRLELTPALCRSLGSTNIIESPHSGVRMRTRRVSRWQDGRMVLRWAASAFLATEKNFRRIMGYKDLWMLKVRLDELSLINNKKELDKEEKAA